MPIGSHSLIGSPEIDWTAFEGSARRGLETMQRTGSPESFGWLLVEALGRVSSHIVLHNAEVQREALLARDHQNMVGSVQAIPSPPGGWVKPRKGGDPLLDGRVAEGDEDDYWAGPKGR